MEFHLNIIDSKSNITKSILKVSDERKNNETILILEIDDGSIIQEKHLAPFIALKKIRLILEKSGKILCCKGSRVDVYPSGGSAIGYGAYKMKMGIETGFKYMVSIFEPEDNFKKLGTVNDQEIYRREWFKSRGIYLKFLENVTQYSGMTVNERLQVSGLWKEFDNAVSNKDKKRMEQILESIELSNKDRESIIKNLGFI